MANKIILKKSSVASKVPLTSDLDYGELALNYADGVLYYKNASNTISAISTGSGGGGEGGSSVTVSTTPPILPAAGDLWWNSEEANLYIYYADGDSSQWVTATRSRRGEQGLPGVVDFSAVDQNILPAADITYDLGSDTHRWRDLYLSGSTINLGGAVIKTDATSGAIALLPTPTVENPNPSGVVVSPTGGISVVETTGGEIAVGAIEEAASSPTAAPVPIDITTTAPTDGQTLVWVDADAKFIPGAASGGSLTVYANVSELPLSGVDAGTMAFVSGNNRLYLWNGAGWFNIALINTSPSITGGLNSSYVFATDGTPIVLTLEASDPEGLPLTWSYQVTSGTLGSTATVTQVDNVFTITPSTQEADAGAFQITFSASDGVNLGTAAASFTLAFGAADLYYNQSILLSTTSTNDGTNNAFVDSSGNDVAVTANGNVTQGSFSPFSPAGWSGFFDGSGDYLTIPYSTTEFDWWTDNYTIEAWVYPTSFSGWSYLDGANIKPTLIGNAVYNSTTNYWGFGLTTAGTVHFAYYNGAAQGAGTTSTATLNAWNHIAMVKNGTNVTLYLNGVGTSIGDVSGTPQSSDATTLTIGAGNSAYINGYVSGLRVVKGTAVYTNDFALPTASPTAITNTRLLIFNNGTLVDDSVNNAVITLNGNVAVMPFAPYRPRDQYITADNGGSAYFDGAGDYLSATVGSAPGTGDFTIEAWVYATSISAARLIYTTRSGITSDGLQAQISSTGQIKVGYSSIDFIQTATNVIKPNRWYHIAVTRESGTVKLWINGVGFGSSVRTNDFTSTSVRMGITADNLLPMLGYISNMRYTVGTALYTADFSVPTAPLAAVSGTALLVNSTNANMYDQTGKVALGTVGDIKSSTSVVKYGNTSIALNGTTDYALIPNSNLINFGSGDFTVEAWIYPTSVTGERGIASLYGYTSNRRSWDISIDGGALRYRLTASGSTATAVTSSAGAVVTDQWQHIAFVRNGTSVVGYVNGVSVVSGTFSGTAYNNIVDPVSVGAIGPNYTGFFAGYISDLRITKGVARYTAAFTPPTAQLGFNNVE